MIRFLLLLLLSHVVVAPLHALIISGGGEPWEERGWFPQASTDLINFPDRRGWYEGPPFGGGQYRFEYVTSNTEDLQYALNLFAKINAPALELYVYDGPQKSWILREGEGHLQYDWAYEVWQARNWHMLNNGPGAFTLAATSGPVPAPRIELYLRKDGPIRWGELQVSPKITVFDYRRATAEARGWDCDSVSGTVYDMETHMPVKSARLSIKRSNGGSYDVVSTSSSTPAGYYRSDRLDAGIYYLSIEADGYAARHLPPWHIPDCTGPKAVYLSPASDVSGWVEDGTGKRLPDVSIAAGDIVGIDGNAYYTSENHGTNVEAKTNARGEFRLQGIPKGYVRLSEYGSNLTGNRREWIAVPSRDVRVTFPLPGGVEVHLKGVVQPSSPAKGSRWLHLRPVKKLEGLSHQEAELVGGKPVYFPGVVPGDYHVTIGGRIVAENYENYKLVTVEPESTATVHMEIPQNTN